MINFIRLRMSPMKKLITSLVPVVGTVIISVIALSFCNYSPYIRVSKPRSGDVREKIPSVKFPPQPSKIASASKVYMAYSDPPHGCHSVKAPPVKYDTVRKSNKDLRLPLWTLIVDDSECDVNVKVEQAELAGFSAVIVHRRNGSEPSEDWVQWVELQSAIANVTFDVFFVGFEEGVLLKDNYVYPKRYTMKYFEEWNLWLASSRLLHDLSTRITSITNFVSRHFRSYTVLLVRWILKYILLLVIVLLMLSPFILILVAAFRNRDRYDYDAPEPDEYFWSEYEKPRNDYHRRERERRRRAEQERAEANERRGHGNKSHQTYCEILEVSANASREEIIKAFNAKIRKVHPDKNHNEAESVSKEMHNQACLVIEAKNALLGCK